MKKHIITFSLISFSAFLTGENDPTKYMYGYAANQAKIASQNISNTIASLPDIADSVGQKVIEGALKSFDKEKQKELAQNLIKGALMELSSTERQQIAYDWTKGSLEAACAVLAGTTTATASAASAKICAATTATKLALTTKASAVAAGSKTIIVSGLASPAAPFVIGGVVIGGTVVGSIAGMRYYRANRFRRCLNTNFGEQLNEEGFPSRCESPAKRLSWWSQYQHDTIVGHYKVEREGLLKKGEDRKLK